MRLTVMAVIAECSVTNFSSDSYETLIPVLIVMEMCTSSCGVVSQWQARVELSNCLSVPVTTVVYSKLV